MSLSWQDVACGLPVPELPVVPEGWDTRFFATVLILPVREAERLRSVAQQLLAEAPVISLPFRTGEDWPCRLLAAPDLAAAPDGLCHARLEFEVVQTPPGAAGG